ncbi:hypothetical protein LTR37_015564 [Vermiconidia calcicola]|uniref:Uncharacterized protein n=1 Tax=Vermiconidia calcicola TaxID=1690605 RepID=A0ACC3MQJ0_9PEZI|nr:hypothetical protein LTR37_015564 [Vermiconidia calcicola]
MANSKRTVLITGCSEGGMGAALAREFHNAGLHVYATARDVSKMKSLEALGIETLPLDIQSDPSIEACAKQISRLDILINNAGGQMTMPIADLSILEAKKLFDLNVWGHIAMTQAFLPLLLKSPKAIIANHTSVGAGMAIPWQSIYNTSKAALSMFSDTLRLELQPFDIAVVNLRTGSVKTNVVKNLQAREPQLPEGSIYAPARELMEKALRIDWVDFEKTGVTAEQWAKEVVADLLKKTPPLAIWRGELAGMARMGSVLPATCFDGMVRRMTSLDKIEGVIRKQ